MQTVRFVHQTNQDSAGNHLTNHGRFTAAYTLDTAANVIHYGVARVHPNDRYEKKIGRAAAIKAMVDKPQTMRADALIPVVISGRSLSVNGLTKYATSNHVSDYRHAWISKCIADAVTGNDLASSILSGALMH